MLGVIRWTALLAVFPILAFPAYSQEAEVQALQRLLNNAGYNVGAADGAWGGKTRAGLERLADAAGLTLAIPAGKPTVDEAAGILASVESWIETERRSFNTQPMPEGYYWGLGSEWFRNIHSWSVGAVIQANGKDERFTVPRYAHYIPSDLAQFRAVGVPAIRMHVNFEGMVFGTKCFWGYDVGYPQANDCYERQYREASQSGWKAQTAALAKFTSDPGIKLYIDAVRTVTQAGFHVMVSPNDFFWGNGQDWTNATADPLLHRYLARDAGLREFFPKWVGALIAALRAEGITNISLQSLNEPRWCANQSPDIGRWRTVERSIFDAARRAAPTLQLVSSAACTAADEYMHQRAQSYADALPHLIPVHADLDNIVYSIHMRLPRMLFIGSDHYPLKAGTAIEYPHAELPRSAGLNQSTKHQIDIYNATKPNRAYYAKVFEDIGSYAREQGIRVIVTEWDVSQPSFGVSQEDRLQLFKDVGDAARAAGVATLYGSTFGPTGFTTAPHRADMPDHRFDPDMMAEIARMNDAPPYDPATADIGDGLSDLVASLAPYFDEVQAAIDALRPKFDFADFPLGRKYDGLTCWFKISREEDGEPTNKLVDGFFKVDGARLKFTTTYWAQNLLPPGAANPLLQSDLGITDDGRLAGLVDLHVMFSEAGEFYPTRQFVLRPAKGKFSDEPLAGEVRFPIDKWMTATFNVSRCQ